MDGPLLARLLVPLVDVSFFVRVRVVSTGKYQAISEISEIPAAPVANMCPSDRVGAHYQLVC